VTSPRTNSADDERDFRLAEYEALRTELLKRVEIRYQLVLAALVGAGTFLSVGVQFLAAPVVLSFPILVSLLAAAWVSNDVVIKRIAAYIKGNIEAKIGDGHEGWEHKHPTATVRGPFGGLVVYATRGIFVVTQVLTVIAGVAVGPIEQPGIIGLVVVDAVVIALTAVALIEGHGVSFEPGIQESSPSS
jgi:hypothetical protein